MAEQRATRRPTQLSDFDGLVQIGHGAFGKVFRGTHKQTKKVFALKKISKRQVKAQNMITQLNNEIKISKKLDHPNVIKLYDTFDDGEDIYLVLELAPNGQLFSKICREGKLDERTTKQIIKELLQAVSYLHSRDPPIIHRDIKPENILLDKNNQVKLADFGWSNFLNKPRKTYCGTFDYLAPEMIDKSGHDQKLDIWCLGVLVFQLLTGKTPFVVSGPKNQIKKLIEQNILDVNINFPNDFPILAKSFVLGMVKRKPEERLTLKEIMNHEWLKANEVQQKPFQLVPMGKKYPREVPLIDAQDNNVISSLNHRIKQLEAEVNKLRINEKALASQSKGGLTDNPQFMTLMNQLRKLRGVQQKNIQLKNDNQKYWEDLGKKDKQIIQLKGQIKLLEDNQQSIDKLKTDKKSLMQKVRKLQKDLQNLEVKNAQLSNQLSGISDSLRGRLERGENIKLSQAESHQFIELLENEIKVLQQKFEESKQVLLKVLAKQKMTKQKQEQLIRLRVEQKRIHEQIKAQLKQQYQQQKDKIILEARTELIQQRQKWLQQRAQIQKMYEQQSTSNSSRTYNSKDDLELQLKTLRQLQSYNQGTINELKIRIRQLEEETKRKK